MNDTQRIEEISANKIELEAEVDNLRRDYQIAVDTLQSHIDETAWTNAKIINAVVFHARVLLQVIRILRKIIL